MNKEKFLTKLKNRLKVLEDSEVEDILSEYAGYIDEKVATGITEEEAVKELGDFEEIVTDLLGAYKVKSEPETKSENLNNVFRKLNQFIESLSKKSGKELLNILIEIILILLFIGFLRLPFILISNLGESLFENLSLPLGSIFSNIWEFMIDLSYIIISVIIFIKFLENRFFANISDEILTTAEEHKKEKAAKETPQKEIIDETKNASIKDSNVSSISKTIYNIGLLILKFFCILMLIGVVLYLLGITIALSIMLYLIFSGIKYYGILILLVSLFFGGLFFLQLGIKFLSNKKFKAIRIFGELFTIIIFTGIGLTISAIEITNTEIIYAKNLPAAKTITETIPMRDNLKIMGYDEIKVDNSLGNTIKIEYNYSDFLNASDIRVELDQCGYNTICLDEDVERINLNKEFLTSFINNLKNNQIVVYPNYGLYKIVYVNETNYALLTSNSYFNPQNPTEPVTPETETLSYVYEVVKVSQALDPSYQNLTLKYSHNFETEVETIRLKSDFNFEANQKYKFTFTKPSNFYETHSPDDIDDIFEEYTLISITLNS